MDIKKALRDIRSYSESPAIMLDCFAERLFHGVGVEAYIVLDFASKSRRCRRNYLTQFDNRRMIQRLNVETSTKADRANIGNKYFFNRYFSDFVKRDWLFSGDSTQKEIKEFVEKHMPVIVKPIGLTQGKGIRLINNLSDINEDGDTAGQYLLEERIIQHHAVSELNQDSVNTVRVYTLKDNHENVHILAALLRVGGSGQCVDNFHAGGTAWPLDEKNGIVMAEGFSINGSIHSCYLPGKDICMIGFQVPNWSEVLDTVEKAAKMTPLRWLGWDIAVTESGVDLVEANNGADIDLPQFLCGKKDVVNRILNGELRL